MANETNNYENQRDLNRFRDEKYQNVSRWIEHQSSMNVEEFRSNSSSDPIFDQLRHLFVDSFEDFYRDHLVEMNFESIENLRQWLDESFDNEKQLLIEGKHRCLILSRDDLRVFAIFRQEDEENVSLLRLVVRRDLKRQGFASKLFEDFSQMFSPTTNIFITLRRINEPALKFFLKHDAIILPDQDESSTYVDLLLNLSQNELIDGDDERQRRFFNRHSPSDSTDPSKSNNMQTNFQCCSLI